MARDWRRLALAAVAAAALASVGALNAHAQAAKKKAKAPAPAEQSEDGEQAQAQPKAPPKKKKQDPVEAQRAIEAAVKLLQGGKADQAAQALSTTLSGGNLPPALMAKALYTRGVANRQLSKPALAISDLTSALWLKGGLGEADRADALQQRAAAYRDAGLSDGGGDVAAASKPPSSTGSSFWGGSASATPASLADQNQPAPASKSGITWSNVLDPFGLFASPAQQPTGSIQKSEAPTQRPEPAAAQTTSPVRPQASGWSSNTEVRTSSDPRAGGTVAAAAPQQAAPPAAAHPPAPAAVAKPAGKFRVQLASVRTQEEALALAAKAKREHPDVLSVREPEVDEAVVGNMGTFYRVRIGPFATVQETQVACAKLKGSGFDCHAVTQ